MLIAKKENGKFVVADHTYFFPNTSFRATGPSDSFLTEHDCYKVSTFKEHDFATEHLETVEPYLDGEFVFTVDVVTKTSEQLAKEQADKIEALMKDVISGTQARLDAFAATKNYDGILSACTYASDPSLAFAADGQRAVTLRSLTWAKLYEIMAAVQSNQRAVPASFADIEDELPALTW